MNIFDFELAGIFAFTLSPLELMLRGTLMYWLLFIILRFILRRDVGSLGISDFLFVVILGDAVVQRFTAAQRLCLVRDGKLQRRNMRREFITDEELNAKIRHEGVEDLASVKRMYLEADGEMSLIRNDEPKAAA